MDAGEAVDGGPGTDELVFPDPHIEEAADEEEPDAQPGPVAFNRVPPSRFVAKATKLSRSCQDLSYLLVSSQASAGARQDFQSSKQHQYLTACTRAPVHNRNCTATQTKHKQQRVQRNSMCLSVHL